MRYVSKHSCQNLFIFCISLFCYAMRYVSKDIGQNFIFFVFLYFAMLCAMFQNIAVNLHFVFILLFRYAMRYVSKHSGQNFIFFVFLYFAMLCATFQNIAGNIVFFFFFIFFKLRNRNFACYVLKHSIAKQTLIKRWYNFLFFYMFLSYVLCFKK